MGEKKSGGSSVLKTALIISLIIIFPAVAFFAIIDGAVDTVATFFKNLVGAIVEGAKWVWEAVAKFFGGSVIKNGMYIYYVSADEVSILKQKIEAQAIDTDNAGITEVLLRKMLLTQAVTSSTKDTICVAEVTEEEILQNTGYSKLDDYLESLEKKENAKDTFPIDDYSYDLYYITDYFFYFKDEKNMVSDGKIAWYLGIMGTTTIVSESNEVFDYVSGTEFENARQDYEDLSDDKKKDVDNQIRKDLLNHYTIDDTTGQMVVWKIVNNINKYSYVFNTSIKDSRIEHSNIEENTSYYSVEKYPINIQNSVNSDQFAVSVELLMHLLNISASPQYLDEFMDFAISKNNVTIKAYSIQNEEKTYSKETYNIDDNFIFELYDMDSIDTMKAYKSIVYDRRYNGSKFESSIDKLPDFENITLEKNKDFEKIIINLYNAYLNDGEDVDKIENIDDFDSKLRNYYKVNYYNAKDSKALSDKDLKEALEAEESKDEPIFKMENDDDLDKFIAYIKSDFKSKKTLSECLLLSYDPARDFRLGDVAVEKVTINEREETSWQFEISSISTWYGNTEYEIPAKTTYYSINGLDATEDAYGAFNENGLGDYEAYEDLSESEDPSNNSKTEQYIYDGYKDIVSIPETPHIVNSDDIFDNVISNDVEENKEDNFKKWTLRGLGLISINDGGNYNEETGAGNGSDYLYVKYNISNHIKYNDITKSKVQNIKTSTALPKTSYNIEEFLSLWKNETGEIGNRKYASDGKKVEYDDIYSSKAVVGDLFESAPEMLFQLLETTDNTRDLVDIFKYIMHIYTDKDYGITEKDQIASAFMMNTSTYSGSDFIVNTELSDEKLVLTKEQLTQAIETKYAGADKVRENLLSCIDDFMYIQENNKVNAVFAVAVTMIESTGGTNWKAIDPSTYNWMSVGGDYNGESYNGKWRKYPDFNTAVRDFGDLIANSESSKEYYFKKGNYSVTTIAPHYCNEEWGTKIIPEMTKIYNNIGVDVSTGGATGAETTEEGITYTTFTVGDRTYKNYKQIEESYKGIRLATYNNNLYSAGCGIVSDAIIGSGFNSTKTPIEVNNMGSRMHNDIVSQLTGLSWEWAPGNNNEVKQGVIDQLNKGYPTIVRIGKNDTGTFRTNGGHFIAILSISPDGNSIYVSDPASRKEGVRTGWLKTSVLDEGHLIKYLKVNI